MHFCFLRQRVEFAAGFLDDSDGEPIAGHEEVKQIVGSKRRPFHSNSVCHKCGPSMKHSGAGLHRAFTYRYSAPHAHGDLSGQF
jgi:hypothetical protein